jgi:hypothetical protein
VLGGSQELRDRSVRLLQLRKNASRVDEERRILWRVRKACRKVAARARPIDRQARVIALYDPERIRVVLEREIREPDQDIEDSEGLAEPTVPDELKRGLTELVAHARAVRAARERILECRWIVRVRHVPLTIVSEANAFYMSDRE